MPDRVDDRVGALLQAAARALPGDESRLEAEALLGHVLGRDRTWLFAHGDMTVDDAARDRFASLVAARVDGTPVAYLVGAREFWSMPLAVSDAVLIPRADTETLVEHALARIPRDAAIDVIDLGTGSGAIALAIARERPAARVLATDASIAALAVARRNAESLDIPNVAFASGHWWAAAASRRFAVAVSNPPYIRADDAHLSQGDLRYEPHDALVSGADGLDAIREIIARAPHHLSDGGWLLVEHGFDQGSAVRALLESGGFADVFTANDLAAHPRVSGGRRWCQIAPAAD